MQNPLTPWSVGHRRTLKLILKGLSEEQITKFLVERGVERVTQPQVSQLVAQTKTKYRTLIQEISESIELDQSPHSSLTVAVARTLDLSIELAASIVERAVLTDRKSE